MSGVANAIRSAWSTLYQVSPIIMQGGSFANSPGGLFPMSALAGQILALGQGLLSDSPDPFFGLYTVIPGGTLINQSVATYPYASLQIAANATVQEPNRVSLLLKAPVKDGFGYLTKTAIFTSLQLALQTHNNAGGSYIVFTPAFMYQNGLLLTMTDVSDGESKQTQIMWQFDFYFPLITQADAATAYNTSMAKFAGGQPVVGAPSWASLGL